MFLMSFQELILLDSRCERNVLLTILELLSVLSHETIGAGDLLLQGHNVVIVFEASGLLEIQLYTGEFLY